MIKVLLFGAAGRMGELVAEELNEQEDMTLVAGVESPGHAAIGSAIGNAPVITDSSEFPEADVWVDFSLATASFDHIRMAAESGKPVVVAVTGFDDVEINKIRTFAESCPVLMASNLSVGMGVMDRLVGETARLLGDQFDPVLSELHHSTKRDAPSGTALWLAEQIEAEGKSVEITSQRAGGAIGEHQMRFVGMDEELVITHRAFSRRAFSRGVPRAVRFIINKKPGLYSIRNMYGGG